jgi:hypothetical protein
MTGMQRRGLAAGTDRARDNKQYVRRLLRAKQPEFAALLEAAEAELGCPLCQTADSGRVSGLRGT